MFKISKTTVAAMARAMLALAEADPELVAYARGPNGSDSIVARSSKGRKALMREALSVLPKAQAKVIADHKAGDKPLSKDSFAALADAVASAGTIAIPTGLSDAADKVAGEGLAFRDASDVLTAWTGSTGKAQSLPSLRAMIAPSKKTKKGKGKAQGKRRAERQAKGDANAKRQAKRQTKRKRKAQAREGVAPLIAPAPEKAQK